MSAEVSQHDSIGKGSWIL